MECTVPLLYDTHSYNFKKLPKLLFLKKFGMSKVVGPHKITPSVILSKNEIP